MAAHKLSIGILDEIDFRLIAIHTSVEDYFLAYLINKNLPILLAKDTAVSRNGDFRDANFRKFTYVDETTETSYCLIQNKIQVQSAPKISASDLFQMDTPSIAYLLPEFKTVDYILKVDNGEDETDNFLKLLHQIDHIATVYEINTDQIKSKNNLIF